MCLSSDKAITASSAGSELECESGFRDRSPLVYEAKMIQTDSNYSLVELLLCLCL